MAAFVLFLPKFSFRGTVGAEVVAEVAGGVGGG